MLSTWNNNYRTLAHGLIFGLLVSILAAMPLMAAEEPGYSPYSAMTPGEDVVTFEPYESQWYIFNYDYNDEDEPSLAQVTLDMQVADSLSFEVWTPNEVRLWTLGEDFSPVGSGTVQDVEDDNENPYVLTWSGSAKASDTYYVIVTNDSAETVGYTLNIEGEDVYFPATYVAGTASEVVEDVEEVAATETVAVDETDELSAGFDPYTAVVPTSVEATLEAGETVWYTFDYLYGDDDEEPTQAYVELDMAIADSLAFEIWTPNEVTQWALGEEVEAVGAGTILDLEDDDYNHYILTWAGSAEASDTYYIALQNVTDSPASYSLLVSGEDVNF